MQRQRQRQLSGLCTVGVAHAAKAHARNNHGKILNRQRKCLPASCRLLAPASLLSFSSVLCHVPNAFYEKLQCVQLCMCVCVREHVCVPACRLKIDAVNQHSSIGQTARLAARQATIRSHHLCLCRVTSRFLYLSIGSRLLLVSILLAATAPAPTPPASAAAASPMCVTYMSICPAACSAGSALTLAEKHT